MCIRDRFSDARARRLVAAGNPGTGTVLVDGRVAALWRLERRDGAAVAAVRPLRRLRAREASSLAAEGRRMVRAMARDAAERDVRIDPPV